MKKYEEYFEAPRCRMEDAPAEILTKIKRICGISKKLFVKDVSASELAFLWKKMNEILDDEFPGTTIKEIEQYLPTARFCCSDFVELPNGIILEDEGRWMQFLANDAAMIEFERCTKQDEDFIALYEAQIEEYERDEYGIRYEEQEEDF